MVKKGKGWGPKQRANPIKLAFDIGKAVWKHKRSIGKAAMQSLTAYAAARAGSGSGTTTKTKTKGGYTIRNGTGMTRSFHTIKYKKKGSIGAAKYITSTCTQESLDTTTNTSLVQQQGVEMLVQIGTGSGGWAGINGPTLAEIFNNAQTNAAGGYLTGQLWTTAGLNQPYKLYLQSYVSEISVTNQSQMDSDICLYLLMSKSSNSTSSTPPQNWVAGLSDMKVGTNTAGANTFPGAKPFHSKDFNIYWKVAKKVHLQLGGGATHIHKENILLNRTVDMEYVDGFYAIRGITYCWMMVWKGQLVDDGATKVAVGPIKIISSQRTFIKSRILSPTANSYRQYDGQETGLLKQQFMDQDGGGIADALVATVADGGAPA